MFELDDRRLDATRPRPHRAGNPVEGPQLVEDGPLDPVDRIGLELEATVRLELVDGVDQAEEAIAGQVVVVHGSGETGPHPARHILDQGRIVQNESLAEGMVTRTLETLP